MVNKMKNKSRISLSSLLSKMLRFEGTSMTLIITCYHHLLQSKGRLRALGTFHGQPVLQSLWSLCGQTLHLKQPSMARSDGHLLPLYLYLDGCINQPLCSLVVILMQSCMKKPTLVSWPVNTTTPTADSVFHRLQPWTKSNSPVTDCRYHKENAFNHELQR